MNRFSEIVNSDNLPGIKVNINEIFDKEIVITNYRKLDSSKIKGNSFCLQIQFKYTEFSNELYVVFTSSEVLLKQVMQISAEMFPFLATIRHRNNYYIFE